MEVAVVAPLTAQHRETAARVHLRRVARALADRGHDVTVYCSQWWGGSVPTFEHEGLHYRAVTTCPSFASFALKLPVILARDRPDVIHAAHVPGSVAVAAGLTRATTLAPAVLDWYEPVPSRFRGVDVRLASSVLVPSAMVAADARESGAADDAVTVLPEWVDVDRIRSTDPVPADLVYSRRLDADANLDAFLLALGELRGRDFDVTVIGDGPLREEYEVRASDLRIDDRVTFTGHLPIEERIAHFRGAHAFVHTASRAPFAHELLRALTCGCVGIVQYEERSAAHELVEGRDRGFRATEPEGLADRIREAGECEHRTFDDSFESYDRGAVLARLEDAYRSAGADG